MFNFGSQQKVPDFDSAVEAGNQARDKSLWLQAAAHYDVALKIDPERGDIWVQFAHCLKEFGAFTESASAYRTSLRLTPNDAEVHVHLAHLLKRTGSYAGAKAEFERAIALNPADFESKTELDLLEDKVKAEASEPQDKGQLVEVVDEARGAPAQPIFREYEVTASHFAQEGALKAINRKLLADIELLTQKNEGLQEELLRNADASPPVSRRKSSGSARRKSVKAGG